MRRLALRRPPCSCRTSCRVAGGQGSPKATAQRLKGLDRSSPGWNLIPEEDAAATYAACSWPPVAASFVARPVPRR
jgi:hypothetical protein